MTPRRTPPCTFARMSLVYHKSYVMPCPASLRRLPPGSPSSGKLVAIEGGVTPLASGPSASATGVENMHSELRPTALAVRDACLDAFPPAPINTQPPSPTS